MDFPASRFILTQESSNDINGDTIKTVLSGVRGSDAEFQLSWKEGGWEKKKWECDASVVVNKVWSSMLPNHFRPSLSGIEYNPPTILVKIRWNAPL